MNISELKSKINSFCEQIESIVLETYFILKKENTEVLKWIDLDGEVQESLKKEFFKNVKKRISENSELRIQNISEATNEKNVLMRYDLGEKPDSISIIKELLIKEDWEVYSFDKDNLSEITGIIFLIHKDDQTFVAYKKAYPINLIKKDSRGVKIWLPRNNERFIEVTEEIYSIYPDLDFFLLNNELFIFNLNVLERFFGFHDVIITTANEAIEKIDDIGILVDSNVLKEIISETTQARKLTQVGMHSPVVGKVTNEDIIDFIDKHPALTGKFKFNEDKTKIELNTKVSAKLFIKLLNDDFLLSELTSLHYDTRAKEKI